MSTSYMAESETVPNDYAQCSYCGYWHKKGICPRIAEIEYYQDGTIKRVRFHKDSDNVIPWPGWVDTMRQG
jgi:hypothetical protein